MRPVHVKDMKVGTVLAKDLYNEAGALVLAGDVPVTQSHIDYFLSHGIETLYIDEPAEPAAEPAAKTDKSSARAGFANVSELYHEAIETMKKVHSQVTQGMAIDKEEVARIAEGIAEMVKKEDNVLRVLRTVSKGEDYLFSHPVNVSILAAELAKWSGYNVEIAAIGGLFHDVGKSEVKGALLYKKEPLDALELETLRRHAMYGYEIMKRNLAGILAGEEESDVLPKEYASEILRMCIEHHEREDGSGYPFGLTKDKISVYSKMISVADVFDAITSDRYYREGVSVYTAFRLMQEESFNGLNGEMTQTFLDKISKHFINNKVKLSDGRVGEVVYINKTDPNRPLVKTGEDFVDLSSDYSISVEEVLE